MLSLPCGLFEQTSVNGTDATASASTSGSSQAQFSQRIEPEIDKLRRDVYRLETAIRETDKAIKDLSDWIFDQLSATTNDPSDDNNISSAPPRTTEIRRIYDERLQSMTCKRKTLQSNLDTVSYIIDHLERHTIPPSLSPKSYIRRLLRQRMSDPSQIGLIVSDMNQQSTTSVSAVDVREPRREKHISRTMPPISTLSARTTDPRVQARTLPSAPTYTATGPVLPATNRRSSVPEMSTDLKATTDVANFVIPNSTPVHSKSKTKLFEGINTISSSRQHNVHPGPRTVTSPESFCHFQEDVNINLKPPLTTVSAATNKLYSPSSVLNNVRRSLGIMTKRLQGHSRSISEENLVSLDSDRPATAEPAPSATPHKSKWRPGKKAKWPPSHAMRRRLSSFTRPPKREPIQLSPSAPESKSASIVLHVPDRTHRPLDLSESRPAPSHSGSICSTNGISLGLNTGLAGFPTNNQITRSSINGAGGVVSGDNDADTSLMKILEPLNWTTTRVTVTTSATGGGRSSSNSSHSYPVLDGGTGTGGRVSGSSELNPAAAVAASESNQVVLTDYSTEPVARGNVALAMTNFYRIWEAQSSMLSVQQQTLNQIQVEIGAIRRDILQFQETSARLAADIFSLSCDARTEQELSNEKLSVANSRLDQLDGVLEEYRMSNQRDLIDLKQSSQETFQILDYRLSSTTRDLNDGITTLSNKLSIIEKPAEHQSSSTHGSDFGRVRNKILHTLTDLCVSVFALLTMVLHMIIRFLNLGALLTESRTLAVGFVLIFFGIVLIYISEPLISTLYGGPIANYSSINSTGVFWRDMTIRLLSLFRRFGRSSS